MQTTCLSFNTIHDPPNEYNTLPETKNPFQKVFKSTPPPPPPKKNIIYKDKDKNKPKTNNNSYFGCLSLCLEIVVRDIQTKPLMPKQPLSLIHLPLPPLEVEVIINTNI